MPEPLVAQIVLRVEETFGADNKAYGAITDARRHLRGGRGDMSFGCDGPQHAVLLIEQRQPCEVGAHKASCAADDRSQKLLQRQGAGEIVGRIDQQAETAFAHAAVADDLGNGIQLQMQPLDVLPGRSRRRRFPHQLDHVGDLQIKRAERRLFEDGRDNRKHIA